MVCDKSLGNGEAVLIIIWYFFKELLFLALIFFYLQLLAHYIFVDTLKFKQIKVLIKVYSASLQSCLTNYSIALSELQLTKKLEIKLCNLTFPFEQSDNELK